MNVPSSERTHIGFFGLRNAGKSSLVNKITNQDLSVVSDVLGTTTDPVKKAMELLPIGPVLIIDTPGYDDTGTLGEKRILKTKQILRTCDIAILVVDITKDLQTLDYELINIFKELNIPYIIVYNKCDLLTKETQDNEICVSCINDINIYELKEKIAHIKIEPKQVPLVSDLINEKDIVILVIPIDSAAPKGRIILPQQQVLRDCLDTGAIPICVKETELQDILNIVKPKLVITDSQAFNYVSSIVPEDIDLTSFSILMARYKGSLYPSLEGIHAIETLKDGDKVLISEGCTHHRQCDDIGTVKIPRWLKEYTGKDIVIETSSGLSFPSDISDYKLIIHCGGCMLNGKEMQYRMKYARENHIPITNYGMTIAYFNGILERSLKVLQHE